MAPGEGPPLSLRPFPVADKKPKNLAEFIARVNAKPGGFRAVTEATLNEEIKAQEKGDEDTDQDDMDMSDAGSGLGADEDEPPTRDPNVARIEVLKNIDIAGNTAMLTLDSLSLLLSKQNPTQAGVTLSQQLRDMVGIGTLGADKLDDSNSTPAKTKDQEDVALGWTIMEINKTRDAAKEATDFLRREIESEGRYWEDIMAVKKAGWSICKVPQERHTLGVRFGFSEAAPDFKNNGLAPMRRNDDGSVELDCGRLGDLSERLVVTYEKDGKVVGRSTTRTKSNSRGPLESRVLEARNTIFSQELWHELSREARTLAAYDVRPEGSKLVCTLDASSKITMELLPLESCSSSPELGLDENTVADSISIVLHILLSYAHRYNELMRIRPIPPHITRSRGQQTYALLRPILARISFSSSIEACTQYVGALTNALQKAGLPASFTLHSQLSSLNDQSNQKGPNQTSSAQTLIRYMLPPLDFTIKLAILGDTSFTIRGRTFLFPVTATYYHIMLPPDSPLQGICVPYQDGYPDLDALAGYLRIAISRLLTEHFLTQLSSEYEDTTWIQGIQGTSIKDANREHLDVQFVIDEEAGGKPALFLSTASKLNNGPATKPWRWAGHGESEGRSLEEVVREAIDQSLS